MAHARVQPRTLGVAQAVRASPWADTGTPADLIDEQVAQPSDDRLIGEAGLEPPTAGEQTIELRARYLERVGAEHREQALERRAIVQQSHALQLAQVAITKLAAIEREDDAVVAMQRLARFVPRERARHAEMKQQNRRRIGRRDEPLAMPRRSPKVPPTQRALQSRGAHAAQHAAVAYQNFADARAGVARQHAAETLDVRKLGQSARAGHSGRICTLRHLMGSGSSAQRSAASEKATPG